jgi:hypothetical protein
MLAAAPKVRVVSTAKLSVRPSFGAKVPPPEDSPPGTPDSILLRVFGTLEDDAGVGQRGVEVFIEVADIGDPGKVLQSSKTKTGSKGEISANFTVPDSSYLVTARVDKGNWLGAAKETARVERGKKGVGLDFTSTAPTRICTRA